MTIAPLTLAAILMMAIATWLTRVGGYLVLGNRTLSPRLRRVMDIAPGCVLISVIAPHFATGHSADLASLALTSFAASRLPLLPTVLIGVASAGVLRHLLPG
ncbi:AzlD family protein (plasmid) [Agrobacterium leguminum]|uniref:Branched-chain amino acid transport n=1 Tax=Agrobacterium deltaense NCPPB 1641 TaxID=1183425 RepID=A0A1S7U8X0_9HYPH|nr:MULTISPECIES: AzlD family protein [Agrobacterium]WFS70029.1 AzlD family protein [Agrobacterium leguminum]CVI63299.1 Branched-chain amino acid transport [Agrobacterium deltaense NCPPB 1641]